MIARPRPCSLQGSANRCSSPSASSRRSAANKFRAASRRSPDAESTSIAHNMSSTWPGAEMASSPGFNGFYLALILCCGY